MSCPQWMRFEIEDAFKGFIERKWRDALNVDTPKPTTIELDSVRQTN